MTNKGNEMIYVPSDVKLVLKERESTNMKCTRQFAKDTNLLQNYKNYPKFKVT